MTNYFPIYINGHRWRDVTQETTAEPAYPGRRVIDIGGDLSRIREIAQVKLAETGRWYTC